MASNRDQAHAAYDRLRSWIDDWTLQPGEVLGEVDLAARLQVSRTPLREALARLRREGLVDQVPGHSATVATVSVEAAVQLYQAREAVENYALELAARELATHAPARDRLHAIADDLAKAATSRRGPDRTHDLAAAFDAALGDACGNPVVAGLLAELHVRLARLRRLSSHDTARLRRSLQQRDAVARAVIAGDGPRAAALNSERLRDSLDVVVRALTGTLLGRGSSDPLLVTHAAGTTARTSR